MSTFMKSNIADISSFIRYVINEFFVKCELRPEYKSAHVGFYLFYYVACG